MAAGQIITIFLDWKINYDVLKMWENVAFVFFLRRQGMRKSIRRRRRRRREMIIMFRIKTKFSKIFHPSHSIPKKFFKRPETF